MTFGIIDIIISLLIDKVKKAPVVKEGKSDVLITFWNIVQNLTSTMEKQQIAKVTHSYYRSLLGNYQCISEWIGEK